MNTVELPKHEKRHYAAMTAAEEAAFVRELKGGRFKETFAVMLYAGLRRGEALALRYGDIDLSKRIINVNKSLYGGEEIAPKTKAGTRFAPISEELLPYLKTCVKENNERLCPISVAVLQKSFYGIRDKAGLAESGITIHSLRHTFVTRCREKGIDPLVIQKWVGHKSLNMTLGVYTHVNPDYESRQRELLDGTE
jgi:integrase